MIISPTPLGGLFVIAPEPISDARGSFARLYCGQEFADAGLAFAPVQMSASFSPLPRTLRGMHWQEDPFGETKLVRVTQGAVFDVAVDLRPASPTYCRWFAQELNASNRLALLIPPGFAHGLLTLAPDTEVLYAMDRAHAPHAAHGARFDDPAFGIDWPAAPAMIGAKDEAWPAFGINP